MKKIKEIILDIFLVVYFILCSIAALYFISAKDNLVKQGYNPSIKEIIYSIFAKETSYVNTVTNYTNNLNMVEDIPPVEEEIIPVIPDTFEWSISEEYDYIKLEKGWSLKPKDNSTMSVISRDPYKDNEIGYCSDGLKARYNQTCSMKGIPYGSKVWLKGSGTAIVFVVADNNCEDNQIVLHQHDKLGELDGEYEVVKCSPPTFNYVDGVKSTTDWDNIYQSWKDEYQHELDEYTEWHRLKYNTYSTY